MKMTDEELAFFVYMDSLEKEKQPPEREEQI